MAKEISDKKFSEEATRTARDDLKYYEELLNTLGEDPIADGVGLLEELNPLNLQHIKKSCDTLLTRFIDGRGKIDSSGKVHISFMDTLMGNTRVTGQKIKAADELRKNIHKTKSLNEISDLLRNAMNNSPLEKHEDFAAVIGECMRCLEPLQNSKNAGLY